MSGFGESITKDSKFILSCLRMNVSLKSLQVLKSNNHGIKGGIKGSFPIWGKYVPFGYLNWAVKYIIDTLMIEMDNNITEILR